MFLTVANIVSFTYVVCARDAGWNRCGNILNYSYAAGVVLPVRAPGWEDYWANSTRPDDDFASTVLELRANDLPVEERQSFD